MTRIFWVLVLSAIFGALARADNSAASKMAGAGPAQKSCFSSFWDYLNSSVETCPLSYGPLTLYGNIDGGFGYEQWGAPVGTYADKPNYAIARNSGNTHWLWSPNATSTSVVGVTLRQRVVGQWELIGVAEAGFNPFSLRLINGPQSLADNNLHKIPDQDTAFNSSRAGQWDNSQGFFGFSHPSYGTLTFGRTSSLSQSALAAYDPVASLAFSQLGFSAIYAGFGAGATARVNTAVTYRLNLSGLRFGAQSQIGGYENGNAATAQYQVLVGADFDRLSFDAVAGYAQNAVSLSSFSGAPPAGYDPNAIVKAKLANTGGLALMARYDWKPFKFYLGYLHAWTGDPSDVFPNGLPTIAQGIVVPPGAVTTNSYIAPRVLDTVWTGFRYRLLENLDLATGVYWEDHNDYLAAPAICTGSGTATSSGKCAGGRYSYSFMLNYEPVPRVRLYTGLMVSAVYGGAASGFLHSQNIAPTTGLRYQF